MARQSTVTSSYPQKIIVASPKQVVEVLGNGPQGPAGPQGPTGPNGPLYNLSDVDVTGIGDYDALLWDAGTSTWLPVRPIPHLAPSDFWRAEPDNAVLFVAPTVSTTERIGYFGTTGSYHLSMCAGGYRNDQAGWTTTNVNGGPANYGVAFRLDPLNGRFYWNVEEVAGIGGNLPEQLLQLSETTEHTGRPTFEFPGSSGLVIRGDADDILRLYRDVSSSWNYLSWDMVNYGRLGYIGFNTTVDRLYIQNEYSSVNRIPAFYNNSSASGANLGVTSAGDVYRSTASSLKIKKDIEPIDREHYRNVLKLDPIWYRSKLPLDPDEWSYYGLGAEPVADIDPRMVHWEPTPDCDCCPEKNHQHEDPPFDGRDITDHEPGCLVPVGVQYDRLTPHLIALAKEQDQRIEELETEVSDLKSRLEALEARLG